MNEDEVGSRREKERRELETRITMLKDMLLQRREVFKEEHVPLLVMTEKESVSHRNMRPNK